MRSPLVSARIDPEVLEAVQDQADREERTVSGVVRRTLRQHFTPEQPDQDRDREPVAA
jgi:predicted transcriptional regulator